MFRREFIYALRQLRRAPGFALLAVLTLALSIGASTAMFTIVNSVVLQPLSYRQSGRLVIAWERVKFLAPIPYVGPNPRHFDLWQKRATAFTGLTLLQERAAGLTLGNGHPHLVGTVRTLPNLFDVLDAKPLLGRSFRPADGVKGHDNVAILSYELWQTQFGGNPNVIGKMLRLADVPREVIGVLPSSFHFPNANAFRGPSKQAAGNVESPSIFVPAALDLNELSWSGEYGNWIAIGRLQPDKGLPEAEAQLNTIQAQIVRDMAAERGYRQPDALLAYVQPTQEAIVGSSRAGLWLLMAAVGGLMLIACVNLANAQLGRALLRQREAAVRSALGASNFQLLASAASESVLLAAVGGAAGVALAFGGLKLFRLYTPVDLPRLAEIHLNIAVLLFALLLVVGATILFGFLPALRSLRSDPQIALQQNSARTPGVRGSRQLRKWLIGFQVFGCTALLLVTGLFAKSLLRLLESDKGFDSSHTVIAEADLSSETYGDPGNRISFDAAVLDHLRAIPGVQSAALVSAMPLEGESWIEELRRADKPRADTPLLNLRWVSPGYFQTIREKLVGGRFFEERDRFLNNAILSEREVKAVWPHENPIGARIQLEGRDFTVIGVVADARQTSLKSAPPGMAYLHYKDRPPFATFFLVRSAQPADQIIAGVRRAIWQQSPDVTIARLKTLDSQVTDSLAPERFQTALLLAFGIGALLLCMLGVYGVLSYTVAGRRQEIGVRMALGASRPSIYALTVGEAAAPVLAGLALGWTVSVLAGRAIQSLLYDVKALDPSVALIVAALFLFAALCAAFLPAHRAASIDPLQALRTE